jgi:hypothetical protein
MFRSMIVIINVCFRIIQYILVHLLVLIIGECSWLIYYDTNLCFWRLLIYLYLLNRMSDFREVLYSSLRRIIEQVRVSRRFAYGRNTFPKGRGWISALSFRVYDQYQPQPSSLLFQKRSLLLTRSVPTVVYDRDATRYQTKSHSLYISSCHKIETLNLDSAW